MSVVGEVVRGDALVSEMLDCAVDQLNPKSAEMRSNCASPLVGEQPLPGVEASPYSRVPHFARVQAWSAAVKRSQWAWPCLVGRKVAG